jgi:hypothetical protein
MDKYKNGLLKSTKSLILMIENRIMELKSRSQKENTHQQITNSAKITELTRLLIILVSKKIKYENYGKDINH